MGCFGSGTPKRHVIWSNDRSFIETLIKAGGYLSTTQRDHMAGQALATHKVDPRTGKKQFTGVKKRLKNSQTFDSHQKAVLLIVCLLAAPAQTQCCALLSVFNGIQGDTREHLL